MTPFRRIAERLSGLEERASALDRLVTVASNTSTIPGLQHTRPTPRSAEIVEVKDLERLGTAGGRTYFAYRDGLEIRVDVAVAAEATNDSLPPNRLILHSTERVAKKIVEDVGADEWSPSVRRTIDAHTVHRYWRATIMRGGSYAAAVKSDAGLAARKLPRPEPVRVAVPHAMPVGRAMIGWLERKHGIALSVEHGVLLVHADRGSIDSVNRALIRDYREMLTGWVSGKPLPCYRCAAEAVALIEPSYTPTCAEHSA